jgi:hypothetical protein
MNPRTSTCSPASADSHLQRNGQDSGQLDLLKPTHSLPQSCGDTGRKSQTTATCETLPLEKQTLLLEDSHARTLASPAPVLDWKENGQDSGESSTELYATYDHVSRWWKTSQLCLFEDSSKSLEICPKSGLMRNGQILLRAPWVRHICDDECSLWPTPTASMDGRGFGIPMHNRTGRFRQSIVLRVQELVGKHGWRIHPNFTETLMGFPIDWSAIGQSETQFARKSRTKS